jgi:hypothetical protein
MLDRRELGAFCLAAATAPVVTCVAFGSTQMFALVAGVAAFAFGVPVFAWLRRCGWPLASRSILSGIVAGIVMAALVVTLVFVGFPPRDFLGDPGPTLLLAGTAGGWGIGLGFVAGVTLFALLRARARSVAGNAA